MTARVRRYSDAADLITELPELIKAVHTCRFRVLPQYRPITFCESLEKRPVGKTPTRASSSVFLRNIKNEVNYGIFDFPDPDGAADCVR